MEHLRVNILEKIDRLRHDPLADHKEELRNLHLDYNRIVNGIYNGDHGVPCDILYIFPPEVWIQIIKESLPLTGYAPALLLLTTVSTKWRDALTSHPILWSHIEIRGSEHDSLATIEIFKHLSRETPVLLSIYAPPRHDVAVIKSILAGLHPRLHEVIIRIDTDMDYFMPDEELLPVFNVLLSVPNSISSVIRIHLEHSPPTDWYHPATADLLADMPLPPRLRELHGWPFDWREMCLKDRYAEYLEKIEAFLPLELVLTGGMHLPELSSLHIAETPSSWMPFNVSRQEGIPHMPNLTHLVYNNAYRSSLITLMQSVAPQLLKLELRIPMHKCDLFRPCLEAAIRLETLCLHVGESDGLGDKGGDDYVDPEQYHPDPTASMPHLRSLKFDVTFRNPNEINMATEKMTVTYRIIRRLIDTFRILYKGVEHLDFDIPYSDAVLPLALEYISELPRLKTLRIGSTIEDAYDKALSSLVLPPLEELDTRGTKLLRQLRAPSISLLKFAWGSYCEEVGVLNGIDASKLWITGKVSDVPVIPLPRDSFPSLVELTIALESYDASDIPGGLKLNLFPFLTSITVTTKIHTKYATELCFELLYQPDNCPSLNQLRFPTYPPDWDILFIMLEKRNFLANRAVSRIRRITLPFISPRLRAPLAALLRGLFASRPSNEDLFMGGNVECFSDEQVTGCWTCLYNFLGPCDGLRMTSRSVMLDILLIRDRKRLISLPPNTDTSIPQWILTRESISRKYLSDPEPLEKMGSRPYMCGKRSAEQELGITVEITEHDQLD